MIGENLSVASITVAWKGSDVLPVHLRSLLGQSRRLNEIIVVDNASADGTLALLHRDFPAVTVLSMRENLGAGGGYSVGLKHAAQKGYDWFWLFDQDSVPAASALQELLEALGRRGPEYKVGVLASRAVDPETGQEYRGGLWRSRFVPLSTKDQEQICFVDTVISSGSLIRREVVERAGLPRADFFMDYVDHEYNLRIRRCGYQIGLVRNSILYHRLGQPGVIKLGPVRLRMRNYQPAWRHYYMVRNETFTIWHLFGTYRSRLFLVIRLLRRAGGVILWDRAKRAKLKMFLLGFRDGLRKELGKRPSLHAE